MLFTEVRVKENYTELVKINAQCYFRISFYFLPGLLHAIGPVNIIEYYYTIEA